MFSPSTFLGLFRIFTRPPVGFPHYSRQFSTEFPTNLKKETFSPVFLWFSTLGPFKCSPLPHLWGSSTFSRVGLDAWWGIFYTPGNTVFTPRDLEIDVEGDSKLPERLRLHPARGAHVNKQRVTNGGLAGDPETGGRGRGYFTNTRRLIKSQPKFHRVVVVAYISDFQNVERRFSEGKFLWREMNDINWWLSRYCTPAVCGQGQFKEARQVAILTWSRTNPSWGSIRVNSRNSRSSETSEPSIERNIVPLSRK